MKYWKRLVLVIVLLLALSAVSVGVMAQEGETVVRTGLRPDAPPYAVRGIHPVGTRDLVIDGESPMEITVWYPALNDDNLQEAITYPYTIKMDTPPGTTATVVGHAISEAPFEFSGSPYPLVILSHGFAMGRTAYAWLAEHLASYGFVVIAPEHPDRFDPSLTTFWPAAITRPQDILNVLGYVDEQVVAGGTLEGLVDTELVAVVGHSSGGYTALAAAGARMNTDGLEARCEVATAAADPNVWLCGLLLPYKADMAELAGLDSVPAGLWPAVADPRIDAIVPMAGNAYEFDQEGLAEITVPMMAIGGTHDVGTPYLWGTHLAYENVSSATKALVAFENADHMIFGTSCDALPLYAEIGFYQLCSDPVWDLDRAHDLTNHFTTAFLLAELYQDSDAAAALAPDVVHFPSVIYEAQGF
jgi:predicted dienelactone hydrolase